MEKTNKTASEKNRAKLKKQIRLTIKVVNEEAYQQNFIHRDTHIILRNQLIIMKTLVEIQDKLNQEK